MLPQSKTVLRCLYICCTFAGHDVGRFHLIFSKCITVWAWGVDKHIAKVLLKIESIGILAPVAKRHPAPGPKSAPNSASPSQGPNTAPPARLKLEDSLHTNCSALFTLIDSLQIVRLFFKLLNFLQVIRFSANY